MSIAIEFNNISKQYRLGFVSSRTLSADLNRWWAMNVRRKEDPYLKIGSVNDRATAADSDFVWALRDIDFKVEQGDVVGIIGKNGAGKSTLLKLLSKVTAPTTGTIRARGRIGALLEVGTGFHPEMTGRENIYMNGAIMGMTKQEITRKLDEIVDFSGCERYIDTPVKRYSSGMTVRLGFAVAAFMEPEILVVDEVLAVGDAEFQKKAIGKMQDVSQGEGRTVLFVSHNMGSIRALCKSGVLLENGMVKYRSNNINDVVEKYLSGSDNSDIEGSSYKVHIRNKAVSIKRVLVNGNENNHVVLRDCIRKVSIRVEGESKIPLNISVEVWLYDKDEIHIASYSPTHWDGTVYSNTVGNFVLEEEIDLPEMLTNGEYYFNIRLQQMNIEAIAVIEHAADITVDQFISPDTGVTFNRGYFGDIMLHKNAK